MLDLATHNVSAAILYCSVLSLLLLLLLLHALLLSAYPLPSVVPFPF
jgi:hypothetical protein